MQEIVVIISLVLAIIYLAFKFFPKDHSHNCDSCGLSETKPSEKADLS